jgi:Bacterial Ig-like domain
MSELSARLELESTFVSPVERIPYTTVNTGSAPILIGEDYGVQRRAAGEWVPVEINLIVRAIGYGLDPGDRRSLTAAIPGGLGPGHYRLCKTALADPSGPERPLASTVALAEFDVVSG